MYVYFLNYVCISNALCVQYIPYIMIYTICILCSILLCKFFRNYTNERRNSTFLCIIHESYCFLELNCYLFFQNKINPPFKLRGLCSICASYIILSSGDKGKTEHILNDMPETDFEEKYSMNFVFTYK